MTKITQLLSDRNNFLKCFVELNQKELERFRGGDFDNIDYFYNARESYLQMIGSTERKISEFLKLNRETPEGSESFKSFIKTLLSEKDDLIKDILEQDLEALSLIDQEKSDIIRDLKGLDKGRKALKGYKTPEIDHRIDEDM